MMKKACMVAVMVLALCIEEFDQERGRSALPGIDTIPLGAIQLSNEQMKNLFIVSDAAGHLVNPDINVSLQHNEGVKAAACNGYVIRCDYTNPLTTPFTFLAKYTPPADLHALQRWLLREINKRGGKIVTDSTGGGGFFPRVLTGQPFIVVNSADNDRYDNFFFFAEMVYDRERDVFTRNGRVLSRYEVPKQLYDIRKSVENQQIIFASTYGLNGREDIVPKTTGCLGVEESCVWLPTVGGSGTATSFQSPRLGSALASLLAVFPEYDVFDLAALTNSCAVPHPNLPGGGIINIPCMIETICEETDSRSSACAVEQPPFKMVTVDTSIGMLENPSARPGMIYTQRSGISAITGWVCDAEEIIIELNGTPLKAGYGTIRTDTKTVCGDTDNGFSLLWNWNLLGDGFHSVEAFADGRKFASTQVRVTTLGEEMAYGISESFIVSYLSGIDGGPFWDEQKKALQWSQSLQNFVIVPENIWELTPPRRGYSNIADLKGYLENPSRGSNQSGISAITGWVCDAEEIIIELNGTPLKAGYGTIRTDTKTVCGDTDNGFSLLWNWNLLGDGLHSVEAFADGRKFASTQVRVTTLGGEFFRGLNAKTLLLGPPPTAGGVFANGDRGIALQWVESLQNFVIIDFKEISPQ